MLDDELEPLYSRPSSVVTLHEPNSPESKSNYASEKNVEEGVAMLTPGSGPSIQDILSFFGIAIMLVWPWIFFGVVWAKKGIQMNDHLAKVVRSYPNTTTYLITFISSTISLVVSELFSLAIIRFAQELVTYRKPTQPFHLTVLLAFRRQAWPWGKSMKDVRYLMTKNRWWPATSVVICVLIFPHLISSTTTLLTPTSFNRTAILTGSEPDFSSNASDCLAWFNSAYAMSSCGDPQLADSRGATACIYLAGSQTVDILEAGRGNMLELVTNKTQSLTFSHLGAGDGLHFQGSVKGVLPLGPNGALPFNSLEPSPLSDNKTMEGMISYDYTLNLQGLTSNISCSYTTQTMSFEGWKEGNSDGLGAGLLYSSNCSSQGEAGVLNGDSLSSAYSNSTLIYWACQAAPNGTRIPSYSIYLAGLHDYHSQIGKITCTVNPIQSAIYPVTYRSIGNAFSTAESTSPSPLAFPALINNALVVLGSIITDGQSLDSNLFAELVLDFGQKFLNVSAGQQAPEYLWLCEQMIQGIMEYEMTFLRLTYSFASFNAPPSCLRTVTGLLHYEVYGWFVTDSNIGFLIPLTIVNLGALFALARAMVIAKTGGYIYHPSHPRPVVYDKHIDGEEQIPDEWMYKVSVRPTTALEEYFDKNA